MKWIKICERNVCFNIINVKHIQEEMIVETKHTFRNFIQFLRRSFGSSECLTSK